MTEEIRWKLINAMMLLEFIGSEDTCKALKLDRTRYIFAAHSFIQSAASMDPQEPILVSEDAKKLVAEIEAMSAIDNAKYQSIKDVYE